MTPFKVSKLTTPQVQRVAKERMIGTAQLCQILEITRQSLLERVERETFPKPIASFGGSFVWDMAEIKGHLPK